MKSKSRIGASAGFLALLLMVSLVFAQGDTTRPAPAASLNAPPGSLAAPTGMVQIRGGSFLMGCVAADDQCRPDEKPAHRVTVGGFWLDEHAVTVAEYQECVRDLVCNIPNGSGELFNWEKYGRDNYPVNGVDWNDAESFCRWSGNRLPTEAEYEYVLRGNLNDTIYPWGDGATPPANFGNYADESAKRVYPEWRIFDDYDDGYVGTSPVCSFARNAFGLCDISGNVWEWTADWYGKYYYAAAPAANPPGPDAGLMRVLRGGSWHEPPVEDRASQRYALPPWDGTEAIGFRCAR
jgi:formylglycine-generating enzyme required for sulfatase activity